MTVPAPNLRGALDEIFRLESPSLARSQPSLCLEGTKYKVHALVYNRTGLILVSTLITYTLFFLPFFPLFPFLDCFTLFNHHDLVNHDLFQHPNRKHPPLLFSPNCQCISKHIATTSLHLRTRCSAHLSSQHTSIIFANHALTLNVDEAPAYRESGRVRISPP